MLWRKALILAGLLLVCCGSAFASVVDVQEYPTGYFVDSDANKYNDPYYRGYGENWGWTHNAIDTSLATTATLSISAFDVDAPYEVDNIYAMDDGIWTLIGSLAGGNDAWSYTTFDLGTNFFNDIDAGLQVYIGIDEVSQGSWIVTLAKSALSVDGGTLPPPEPGPTATPEPGTMALLGLGLAGAVLLRKKMHQA